MAGKHPSPVPNLSFFFLLPYFTDWLTIANSEMFRPWLCSVACLKPSPGLRGYRTLLGLSLIVLLILWCPTAAM